MTAPLSAIQETLARKLKQERILIDDAAKLYTTLSKDERKLVCMGIFPARLMKVALTANQSAHMIKLAQIEHGFEEG